MEQADYILFHPEWKSWPECELLHDVAEEFRLNIIDDPEEKLSCCPFCGGEAILMPAISDGAKAFAVQCQTCKTTTDCYPEADEAIASWEHRTETVND